MRSRVELFEQIRRDHDREGLSQRALARRHGVHRRTVRQALESAVPPERKRPEGRPALALGAYRELIDSWLEADKQAPLPRATTASAKRNDGRNDGIRVSETSWSREFQCRRAMGLFYQCCRVVVQASEPGPHHR